MKRTLFAFAFSLVFCTFVCCAETVVFEEPFDKKLRDGWSWLREVAEDWRIQNDALEIKMEPLPQNGARNILYRKPPKKDEGDFNVSVELKTSQPYSNQYQQAGIYWMQGDAVKYKFVMERIDGQLYVFPGKIPLETEHVVLRVRIEGNKVIAEFQPNRTGEFRKASEATLPERNDETDRIAIQCWHGPADKETWTRFLRFSITKPK
jgi:hypothetical protein